MLQSHWDVQYRTLYTSRASPGPAHWKICWNKSSANLIWQQLSHFERFVLLARLRSTIESDQSIFNYQLWKWTRNNKNWKQECSTHCGIPTLPSVTEPHLIASWSPLFLAASSRLRGRCFSVGHSSMPNFLKGSCLNRRAMTFYLWSNLLQWQFHEPGFKRLRDEPWSPPKVTWPQAPSKRGHSDSQDSRTPSSLDSKYKFLLTVLSWGKSRLQYKHWRGQG